MLSRLNPLHLNDRWRVVADERQWILEYRKGNADPKSTGWRARSFHTHRASLLCRIRELCGDLDPNARAYLAALPERFE